MVRNWAMRFEAKHNYFKKLVDKINNFKNISYSLAKRHQALQAYLLQSTAGNFLRISLEAGPGTVIQKYMKIYENMLNVWEALVLCNTRQTKSQLFSVAIFFQ